jgi:Secretion system C-terminal sorting domain
MRKLYSIIAVSAIALSASAQSQRFQQPQLSKTRMESAYPSYETTLSTPSNAPTNAKPGSSISPNAKSALLWEQVIGYSTYDNQSNNSNQNRIYLDEQDQAHATWTFSLQPSTWPDRGTAYNMGQGYVWGVEPYQREESFRTGWPGLTKLGNGGEAVICHSGTGALTMHSRSAMGSGAWTTGTVPSNLGTDVLWPRSVCDGNTLHVIGLTAPTGLGGTAVAGVDGNLIYWRSDDNGATWTIQDHIFPELDSNEFKDIEADSYAIDARNGKVAIAIFSEDHDSVILTSADGGNTWTSTVFMNFPIAGYEGDNVTDIELDGVVDTMNTTDGTGALIIDGNGMAHIAFGYFAFFDDTAGDSLYTTFMTEDLLYWNESYATDELYIIGSVELADDGNTTFDVTIDQAPDYRTSMASMPTMGEDADGNLYVVFAAADEAYLGDQVFRHLYVSTTPDQGVSWNPQVELTPDVDVNEYEYVFPSMDQVVGDQMHIVAERDNEPGLIVRGDLDASSENEIIYLAVTTDLDIAGASVNELQSNDLAFSVYPNPSSGMITLAGSNLANVPVRVYNAMGQEVLSTRISKEFNANDMQQFDFTGFPAGMYSIVLGNGTNRVSQEFLIQH